MLDDLPTTLIKASTKSIRAWRAILVHIKNRLLDFFFLWNRTQPIIILLRDSRINTLETVHPRKIIFLRKKFENVQQKLKKSEVGERRKQSLEEEADVKVSSKKIPKNDSGSKDTEKPKNVKKDNPAKASEVSSSTASKSGVNSLAKPKKQKLVKNSKKEETEFLRGSASTERQPTKSPAKASEKKAVSPANVIRQWPFQPTIDEIREAAVDIVKNADDNAAILDIIDSIGAHFYVDLTPREKEVGRIVMDTIAALEEEHEPDDLFDEEEEYYDSG